MYVVKYNKASMATLLKSIEKYPAIYDTKTLYSKYEVDKAWDLVALEVGEKDSLCRERWHSIKSCYIRHLKFTAFSSRRRPYYLAEYLDFLAPFVQDRLKNYMKIHSGFKGTALPAYLKETLNPPETSTPNSSICLKELEPYTKQITSHLVESSNTSHAGPVIKSELLDHDESNSCKLSTNISQPSSSTALAKRRQLGHSAGSSKRRGHSASSSKRTGHSASSSKITGHSPSSSKITGHSPSSSKISKPSKINSNDPDVHFFKSLIPDISRMSSHQRLKFKQETLSIIEDILFASEEINVTE